MTENEFKIMLTEAQYNAVHSLYSWDSELEQVNHYYDTGDLYYSDNHITVRVRTISGKFLLQMKLPADVLPEAENSESGLSAVSRKELEREFSEIPESISGSVLSELSGISGLPDAKLLGCLYTARSVKRFTGGEIDLDKSEYFGKTDYELEVEFTDEAAARKVLSEIEGQVTLDHGAPVTGKIRRFLLEYLKK